MLTPSELTIQRMTLKREDERHRAEIRADVVANWPRTIAEIDLRYEERFA